MSYHFGLNLNQIIFSVQVNLLYHMRKVFNSNNNKLTLKLLMLFVDRTFSFYSKILTENICFSEIIYILLNLLKPEDSKI